MARFRRRKASQGGDPDDQAALEATESDAPGSGDADAEPDADQGGEPAEGPFDESDADRADQSLPRLSLGALIVPGLPDLEVQLEADPNSQQVRALTAILGDAGVQLQPFAAPRSEGLWDEMRAEILAELGRTKGAKVLEDVGEFGPEVQALVPVTTPDGRQAMQQVRYAGVDGPRWMLRIVFLGRAAVEPDPQDALHRLIRQTIVVRGASAMAPGDPLPLVLPEQPPAGDDAVLQVELEEDVDEDERGEGGERFAGLDPFERGPEITETR